MVQITATKKGELLCEHKIVLTQSQLKKLESPRLSEHIDNLLKDFHFNARGVEDNGNIQMSVVSRQAREIDNEFLHNMEIAHNNFLSAVDNMELPAEEDNDPEGTDSNDDDLQENIDVPFIEDFLKNLKENEYVVLAKFVSEIPGIPFLIPNGMQLTRKAIIELFEAYIKLNK